MTTDDELRRAFRAILDDDPDCPLTDNARKNGSEDPAVVSLMAGFLVGRSFGSGDLVDPARARRIVAEEFAFRRARSK